MKKLLSFVTLMMLSIMGVSAQEDVFTVVGAFNDEGADVENVLFGTTWAPTLEANDMVKGEDGLYTLTKKGVELQPCTVYYKVVKNHAWDTSWGFPTDDEPGRNADYVVNKAGIYDVTFTFNPDDVLSNGFNLTMNLAENVTFDFSGSALHAPGEKATDEASRIFNATFNVDNATMQLTAGLSPTYHCYYNNRDTCLNIPNGSSIEFVAPMGRTIVGIEFTAAGNSNINRLTASSGTIEGMTWTGNAEGVRFSQGGPTYLAQATLTIADKTDASVALSPIDYTECANIAAFNALEAGTPAKLTLTDAEVTGVSADGWSTAWIQDATGGAMIQYSSLIASLQEKTQANGVIYVTRNENAGKSKTNEALATINSEIQTGEIQDYTVLTGSISELNVAANLNRVVKITGAKFEATSNTAGQLTLNGDTISVNNGGETANEQLHKISFQKGDVMEDVVMVAILSPASATKNQLLPLSMELLGETESGEELNVERYPGMGYGTTTATVDFTAAKEFLGVDEVTTDMLVIVNPDGTEIKNYASYDGWFNGEGTAEYWGDNTKICVKFFQAIESGKFEVCDMNGADELDATYTVKWALKANGKTYTYTINVTFVEAPVVELQKSDLTVVASVEYPSNCGSYQEKVVTLTDEQVQSILTELGLESLDDADVYGYNPTTGELLSNYVGYDGWRDANGDFAFHSGNSTVPACVKYDDGQNYYCYSIAGCEEQTIKTYWAIANAEKYVLVEIDFIYGEPEAIELELTDVQVEANVTYNITWSDYTEQTYTLSDDEVKSILDAIELESFADEACEAYIYDPATGEFAADNFDGWRSADGLGHGWTGTAEAPACTQFRDSETLYFYNLYGIEPQTITTYFAIANDETSKAALIKVNFVYEGEFPTYTVAGTFKPAGEDTAEEPAFFGTSWATDVEANDMQHSDRTIWTLTYSNVSLAAGTIFYKVVADHSWDQTWGFTASETNPNGNADYVVKEAGNYDVTFTFSPVYLLSNEFNVTCDVVKLEPIKGDVNGDRQVGIGDIVAITNVMAGIEKDEAVIAAADLNGDGNVGIGDIVAVTNIMAGLPESETPVEE